MVENLYEWSIGTKSFDFYIENLKVTKVGVYHESRPLTPKLGVSDRVRLHVVFVRAVRSAASAVMAVVGDSRSGDPLHKRVEYNGMSHIYITFSFIIRTRQVREEKMRGQT